MGTKNQNPKNYENANLLQYLTTNSGTTIDFELGQKLTLIHGGLDGEEVYIYYFFNILHFEKEIFFDFGEFSKR